MSSRTYKKTNPTVSPGAAWNAIGKAGYVGNVVTGMGRLAFEFFRSGTYDRNFKYPPHPSKYVIPEQLVDLYESFIRENPVVSIKKPLAMMIGKLGGSSLLIYVSMIGSKSSFFSPFSLIKCG
ncbi:hypothetical protein HPG69_004665 [Diceros bicornis minor]|uniref:phosphopyruvate hydratase n=1 Tax=Diceros bicornis minor TaxID=77932 RepID=A0A7J7E4C6_DICBM|nr:hypothetical protein HPG69_004665 [Diceros bicornis minor]